MTVLLAFFIAYAVTRDVGKSLCVAWIVWLFSDS